MTVPGQDFLRTSGWGPFRMPGERARLARLESEARSVLALAKRTDQASPGQYDRHGQNPPAGDGSPDSAEDDEPHPGNQTNPQQASGVVEGAPARLGDRYLAFVPTNPVEGEDVRELQEQLLNQGYRGELVPDGVFGSATDRALTAFQSTYGIRAEGMCGRVSLLALNLLREKNISAANPAPAEVLERIKWSAKDQSAGPIVIDPVYLMDADVHADENDALTKVRDLLEGIIDRRLDRQTLHPQEKPGNGRPALSSAERATFSNGMEALLVVSIAIETDPNRRAGVATYHSTDDHAGSHVGHALATYIQEELVLATGAEDLGIHAEDTEMFSSTMSPSVRVVIGNAGHYDERLRLLQDWGYREAIAQSIAIGIQRLRYMGARQPPVASAAQ